MKDKVKEESLWTIFYLITGASFFTFSKLIQYMEGVRMPAFTWIGIGALLIGSINKIRTYISRSEKK